MAEVTLQKKPTPMELLAGELESLNVTPAWTHMARVNPPLPNPKAIPFVWEYAKLRPGLITAGELVSEEQAERRVLMLINPKKDLPCTTDTLFGGYQLVMPNETAPAHRHTAFALRFIIEGNGGFTAVNGQRISMDRGDVILTPSWNWHDHGKDGSGPMIWLDGLDVPSFGHFPVHFVEHYQEARYPAQDTDKNSCPIVFPWAQMQSALDLSDEEWVARPYLTPEGQQVSATIGASAERLKAQKSAPKRQETASSIYHVIEGAGRSKVGQSWLEWQKGELAVYLYRFDDRPMLEALNYYRMKED